MIKLTSKTLLLTGCLLASSVQASLIDSSLTITGKAILDTTDANLALNSNTYSANMYSVVGGTNTSGDANGVQLTSIGDGFGHTGSLSGNHTLVSTLGGDYDFSIQNSSADDFLVTFGITFYHQADADDNGTAQDARARSRLDVVEGSTEHLYSVCKV